MLTAQIFSALTVSLCLLIDNIMIGRFYRETGIAAYGLANPILLAIGAVGSMLAAGVQVACSRSLGRGSQEETNEGYSTAVLLAGSIAAVFLTAVMIFAPQLAGVLGANPEEKQLFGWTTDYLRGFCIGAPGSIGALVLVPFLQMAGESGLLIAAVLTMTVADVAGDLLSVLVFNGGMFGMGLASALSYYAALLVGGRYFFTKRCIFRFSFAGVTRRKLLEILRAGVPAGFTMAASVVLVFALNRFIGEIGANGAVDALAAYTVITTIGNAAGCVNTGIGGVSLTLSSIFYNEEDRSGLRETVRNLGRHAIVLGLITGAALAAAAPLLASLFIADKGPAQDMAVLGLRLFAIGILPCCLSNLIKYVYQGTERVTLTVAVSLIEGAVIPVGAAFLLSRFMGVTGIWCYYLAGEWLTVLLIGLYVYLRKKELPWKKDAVLLLRQDFGVSAENLLEMEIRSTAEAMEAAERAEAFCLERCGDRRVSRHVALCVEETAANIIDYGFSGDDKPHHLSVRLQHKDDRWVLRFRDDCRAFDPVHYEPKDGKPSLGLRMVRAMADKVSYTSSLNLNNLALSFLIPGGERAE